MPIPRISASEAYKLHSSGRPPQFLDVRNPTAWAKSDETLPRAIRIPLDELKSRLDELDRNIPVVAYCT